MATALAVELAANCPSLPDCPAGHAGHGLARNQRQGTFAQRSWSVSVHLQPCNDGGSRVGAAGAAGEIPNQNVDRHGRRATAGVASSTTWNGRVNSPGLSARVRGDRFLLQCLLYAAKERLSAKLYVCWSNDGPRIQSVGVSRRATDKTWSTESFHARHRSVNSETRCPGGADAN